MARSCQTTSSRPLRRLTTPTPRHRICFFLMQRPPPRSTLFPYTTLFRSARESVLLQGSDPRVGLGVWDCEHHPRDRKSTRLNSSHMSKSYAVFCLKKEHKNSSPLNAHLKRRRDHDRSPPDAVITAQPHPY